MSAIPLAALALLAVVLTPTERAEAQSVPNLFWFSSSFSVVESQERQEREDAFVLQTTRVSSANIDVSYTIGGTATCGVDYTIPGANCSARTGTFTIPAMTPAFTNVNIPMTALGDEVSDSGETVILTFIDGADYNLGDPITTTLRIIENTGRSAFRISGQPQVNGVLTGNRVCADPDGEGSFSYQWRRNTDPFFNPRNQLDARWHDRKGATSRSYTLQPSDAGYYFLLRVIYTDGKGLEEFVHSQMVGPIGPTTGVANEVKFSHDSYNVREGDPLRPTLTFSSPTAEEQTFAIGFNTCDAELPDDINADTNADFQYGGIELFGASLSVTVPAGVTRHTFSLPVPLDGELERPESFVMSFDKVPPGVAIGDPQDAANQGTQAHVQITDASLVISQRDHVLDEPAACRADEELQFRYDPGPPQTWGYFPGRHLKTVEYTVKLAAAPAAGKAVQVMVWDPADVDNAARTSQTRRNFLEILKHHGHSEIAWNQVRGRLEVENGNLHTTTHKEWFSWLNFTRSDWNQPQTVRVKVYCDAHDDTVQVPIHHVAVTYDQGNLPYNHNGLVTVSVPGRGIGAPYRNIRLWDMNSTSVDLVNFSIRDNTAPQMQLGVQDAQDSQQDQQDDPFPEPGAMGFSDVTDSGMTLSWSQRDVDHYLVHWAENVADAETQSAQVDAGTLTYTITGLKPGTEYAVIVYSQDYDEVTPTAYQRTAAGSTIDTTPQPPDYSELKAKVRTWAGEQAPGSDHAQRWNRVLAALGDRDAMDDGHSPMTASEAQGYADRGWTRWDDVVTALTEVESRAAAEAQAEPEPEPEPEPPPPDPELSLSAGSAVDEGASASFTLHADAAPAADLTVNVSVAQSGDWLASPGAGTRAVTLAAGATTASLDVATVNDGVDEPDGSVSVTLGGGAGYTVAASPDDTASVTVRDDDDPPPVIAIGSCVSVPQWKTVKGYYDANANRSPNYGANWYRVLIAYQQDRGDQALPVWTGQTAEPTAAYTVEEAENGEKVWRGWTPVREVLECLERTYGGTSTSSVIGGTPNTGQSGEVGATNPEPTTGSNRWNSQTAPGGFEPDAMPDFATGSCVSPRLRSEATARAGETWRGASHVERWLRVGQTFSGGANDATIVTPAEAHFHAAAGQPGWLPVADALRCMEQESLREAMSR